MSLIIYRLLANILDNKYTATEILKTIRGMELVDTQYNGYIPAYTRTQLTDELHYKDLDLEPIMKLQAKRK